MEEANVATRKMLDINAAGFRRLENFEWEIDICCGASDAGIALMVVDQFGGWLATGLSYEHFVHCGGAVDIQATPYGILYVYRELGPRPSLK
jgi:hypothetical protein